MDATQGASASWVRSVAERDAFDSRLGPAVHEDRIADERKCPLGIHWKLSFEIEGEHAATTKHAIASALKGKGRHPRGHRPSSRQDRSGVREPRSPSPPRNPYASVEAR